MVFCRSEIPILHQMQSLVAVTSKDPSSLLGSLQVFGHIQMSFASSYPSKIYEVLTELRAAAAYEPSSCMLYKADYKLIIKQITNIQFDGRTNPYSLHSTNKATRIH